MASELFFCVFLAKIPAKREMLLANRELHLVARVAVFLKVSSLWINSQRFGRNLRTKGAVWEEKRVRFSARFRYFRQFSRTRLTWLPTSVFDNLGVLGKLVIPSSLKF